MTRKDFELIAALIRDSDNFYSNKSRARFAQEAALRLVDTNPQFDTKRFIEACKPTWIIGTRAENAWDRVISES